MEFEEQDAFCMKSNSLPVKGRVTVTIDVNNFSTFPRNIGITKQDQSSIQPSNGPNHDTDALERASTLDVYMHEQVSEKEAMRRRAITVLPPRMRHFQVHKEEQSTDMITELVPMQIIEEAASPSSDSFPSPMRKARTSLIPPPKRSVTSSMFDGPAFQSQIMGYAFSFQTVREHMDAAEFQTWLNKYTDTRKTQEDQWKEFLGIDITGQVFFELCNPFIVSASVLGEVEYSALLNALTSIDTPKSQVGKQLKRWQASNMEEKVSILDKLHYTEKLQSSKQKSTKGEDQVRGGIPMFSRAFLWSYSLGLPQTVREQPSYYQTCKWQLSLHNTNSHKEIHKDVRRTMKHYPQFQTAEGVEKLATVLCCISFRHAYQGYCQSLNMLAGMLLVFLNEENSFWALDKIMTFLPKDYYSPSMLDIKVDIDILSILLARRLPHLDKHQKKYDVNLLGVCISWLLCCYVDILPWETALRVWDCLFQEQHSGILVSIALAIFSILQPTLLSMTNMGDIMLILMNGPAAIIDANQLITLAYEKQFHVSQNYMDKQREKLRPQYEQEYIKNLKL